MSIDTLIVQCWSRRLPAEKFIIHSRKFVEQHPTSAEAICSGLFKALISSPAPPSILLAYINASLVPGGLVSASAFLHSLLSISSPAHKSHLKQLLPLLQILVPTLLEHAEDGKRIHALSILSQVLDIILGALDLAPNMDSDAGHPTPDEEILLPSLGVLSTLASHAVVQSTISEPADGEIEMVDACKAKLDVVRRAASSESAHGLLSLVESLLQLPITKKVTETKAEESLSSGKVEPNATTLAQKTSSEAEPTIVPSVLILFLTYDVVTSPCYMQESEIIERWKRISSLSGHSQLRSMISEMLIAAMMGLVEDRSKSALDKNHIKRTVLWESYLAGCLARFIAGLLEDESGARKDMVEPAIATVLRYRSLIKAVVKQSDDAEVGGEKCIWLFLKGCEKLALVSPDYASAAMVQALGQFSDVEMKESHELDGEVALEDIVASLREDSSERNIKNILHLLRPGVDQPKYVQTMVKLVNSLSKEFDLQLLADILKVLMFEPHILKVLFHHSHYPDTLKVLRQLLDTWTMDDDISGDSQMSYECYGTIFTFVYHCTIMFKLNESKSDALGDESGFYALWLNSSGHVFELGEMDDTRTTMLKSWINALFDSDGISDDLIKSSRPQELLTLTPTIFRQCIAACKAGAIDFDALRGALEYFLQPFLSYTLLSAIQYLLWEIAAENSLGTTAFSVLDMFLSSENFPVVILRPLSMQIIRYLSGIKITDAVTTDAAAIARLRTKAEETIVGYPELQPWAGLSSPPTLMARFKTMIASVAAGVPSFVPDDDEVPPWEPSTSAFQGLPDLILAGDILRVFGPQLYVETLVRETFNSPLSMAMVQGHNSGSDTDNLSFTPPLVILASKLLTVPMVYSWNYHLQPINLLRILFTRTLPSLSAPQSDPLDVTSTLRTSSPSFVQGRLVGLLLIHIVIATLDPSMRVDDLTLIEHILREGERRRNGAQVNGMTTMQVGETGLAYTDDDFRGFLHALQMSNNRLAWDRIIPVELRNYVVSSLATVPNV